MSPGESSTPPSDADSCRLLRETQDDEEEEEEDDDEHIWESMCLHVLERLEMTERWLGSSSFPPVPDLPAGDRRPTSPPLANFSWSRSSKRMETSPKSPTRAGTVPTGCGAEPS
jgi:hypothetical protein